MKLTEISNKLDKLNEEFELLNSQEVDQNNAYECWQRLSKMDKINREIKKLRKKLI